jgi:hypothetical protein
MVSFLDLPAELRNVTYHHALARGRVYDLRCPLNPSEEYNGLLFASLQIRNEALPIWWAENDFVITTNPQTTPQKHPWDLLGQQVPTDFKNVQILTLHFHLNRGHNVTAREAREGNVWVCMEIIGERCWIRVEKAHRAGIMLEALVMIKRLESALERELIGEVA